jgi:hypothetical protein
VDYILNDLYLAKYDGSQPYTTSLEWQDNHTTTISRLASRHSRDRLNSSLPLSFYTDGGPVNVQTSTIPSILLAVEP